MPDLTLDQVEAIAREAYAHEVDVTGGGVRGDGSGLAALRHNMTA
ncbi:hypothetical protein [Streptomyces sp. CA-251247]